MPLSVEGSVSDSHRPHQAKHVVYSSRDSCILYCMIRSMTSDALLPPVRSRSCSQLSSRYSLSLCRICSSSNLHVCHSYERPIASIRVTWIQRQIVVLKITLMTVQISTKIHVHYEYRLSKKTLRCVALHITSTSSCKRAKIHALSSGERCFTNTTSEQLRQQCHQFQSSADDLTDQMKPPHLRAHPVPWRGCGPPTCLTCHFARQLGVASGV